MTALRRKGGLSPQIRLGQAIDTSYTLLGPELFHLLVTERSWSIPEWERWTLRLLRTSSSTTTTITTKANVFTVLDAVLLYMPRGDVGQQFLV
jgi:hypothetical protein